MRIPPGAHSIARAQALARLRHACKPGWPYGRRRRGTVGCEQCGGYRFVGGFVGAVGAAAAARVKSKPAFFAVWQRTSGQPALEPARQPLATPGPLSPAHHPVPAATTHEKRPARPSACPVRASVSAASWSAGSRRGRCGDFERLRAVASMRLCRPADANGK